MWAISANQVTLSITTWRFGKASEEVVIRTFSLRTCDLNDLVGVSLVWNIFRSEEFLSQFSDPNHIIGDWSVVCGAVVKFVLACGQVVSELPVWRRVVNESELCSADRSLCLPSGFLSTIPWFRGWRWIVIGWFVHPTQHSSLWSQFFVCRDRGKEQFYQLKFSCIRRHQNICFNQSVSSSVKKAVQWLLTGLFIFCIFL